MSNQNQNDQQHQWKCFVSVIICNYRGESHLPAATWPCTCLLSFRQLHSRSPHYIKYCWTHLNTQNVI